MRERGGMTHSKRPWAAATRTESVHALPPERLEHPKIPLSFQRRIKRLNDSCQEKIVYA